MSTYFLLVSYIIMPKLGSVDFSVLSLLMCFSVVFLKNIRIKSVPMRCITKNHIVLYFFMVSLLVLSLVSFIANSGGDIDFQFTLKPIRVVIVSLMLIYIAKSEKLLIKDVAVIIMLAASINSTVVVVQYIVQILFGISDFLLNPNFSESVITPYRKPGLMSGYPTAGILSILGILSAIYLYRTEKINKFIFIALFFLNGATCFMTARTAVYLFIVVCLPYFMMSVLKRRGLLIIITTALSLASIVTYVASSDDKVLSGTVDKMFANIINYSQKGTFNDYSTEDLLENHYEFPNDQFILFFGNSKSSYDSETNSDVSIFKIAWNSGILSSIIYVLSYLFIWFSSLSMTKDKREKVYINIFFCVFFIANAKGFYFFSRVVGDSSMLLWCVATCRNMLEINEGGNEK
ncbi:hypothetical protein ACEUD4_06940 [Aeromonas media]